MPAHFLILIEAHPSWPWCCSHKKCSINSIWLALTWCYHVSSFIAPVKAIRTHQDKNMPLQEKTERLITNYRFAWLRSMALKWAGRIPVLLRSSTQPADFPLRAASHYSKVLMLSTAVGHFRTQWSQKEFSFSLVTATKKGRANSKGFLAHQNEVINHWNISRILVRSGYIIHCIVTVAKQPVYSQSTSSLQALSTANLQPVYSQSTGTVYSQFITSLQLVYNHPAVVHGVLYKLQWLKTQWNKLITE